MRHQQHENPMTEIALALAMGFFSIMVLTLISFGSPAAQLAAVTVAPSPEESAVGGAVENQSTDLIVIVDDGRYLDTEMAPLTPAAIDAHVGRVVLAVDPAMPLQAVIELRGQLRARNLVVVNLNTAWRNALAALNRVRR